jgi:predicted RND superfamily exporter protein
MLIAGLMVMLNSSFVPIQLFSELMTVTIAMCLVGDLVLLPALLKLFWPEHSKRTP